MLKYKLHFGKKKKGNLSFQTHGIIDSPTYVVRFVDSTNVFILNLQTRINKQISASNL